MSLSLTHLLLPIFDAQPLHAAAFPGTCGLGSTKDPDCSHADSGTCGNACCKMRGLPVGTPDDVVETIKTALAKGGPDGAFTPAKTWGDFFNLTDGCRKLDPAESDRLLGLLCADSFRMSKASSGDDKTPPSVLDMNYSVVLSLLHMMHEAARDQEPSLADMVPKELSDAWVPFAKLKPQLQIAGILRHYPMGDAAYVTVVHDLHKGLPESMAPGGAHHYESHLTWVKDQDGWRLQNKIWVDVQGG